VTIAKRKQVFSDFSGGHYGALGPFKAAPNQFRGINVQRYANGTVGPRPGWKLLETSGTAPSPSSGSGSEFYGMMWVPSRSTSGLLVFVSKADSSATKQLDMDTLTWADCALDAPTNDMILEAPGAGNLITHQEYYVVAGGIRYANMLLNSAGNITYPNSFSPKAAAIYKARMYAWGDSSLPNRIYYSEANDFFSASAFASDAYFDVGMFKTVIHCWPIRDSLLILTLAGAINTKQNEAEWWVLQGANPRTGSLRYLGRGKWPFVGEYAAQFGEALLWLDALYDHGLTIHDGSSIDLHSLGRLTARASNDTAGAAAQLNKPTVAYGEPAVAVPYRVGYNGWSDPSGTPIGEYHETGLQGWELVNGTWTKALYWNGAPEYVVEQNAAFMYGLTTWEGDKLIACTNTSTDGSGTFKFYVRNITLNRPSFTTDTYADPTETHSDVSESGEMEHQMWLPAIQSDEGSGVRIRKVIVDFDYWKNSHTSPANTAFLSVQVGNFRQVDGGLSLTEEQRSDSSVLATSDIGHPKQGRWVFRFPETGWYSGCQVRFTELRNVAIDKVTVIYDENTQEPQ